jgi:hypothetical protein
VDRTAAGSRSSTSPVAVCHKPGLPYCGARKQPSQVLQKSSAHLHLILLLLAELGNLRYLQFFNLTCNDCGGRLSSQCINSTSCALAPSVCTCPNTASSSSSSPTTRHLLQDGSDPTDTSTTDSNGTDANSTGNSTWGNGTDVLLGVGETGGASTCNYANFSL